MINLRIAFILVSIALATPVSALDGASVERGKELFSGTHLGTSGTSCGSCHQNGKGLENVHEYDDAQLGAIINQCIVKPIKGKSLDASSTDMKSLVMYLKTFSRQHHE